MKQIKVGSVLFLGGLAGCVSLFFIAASRINAQISMHISSDISPDIVNADSVDYTILHSIIDLGLKVPLFIFLAIMFLGFYFLLAGLEKKA